MLKILLLVVFGPPLLVAAVLVSPLVLAYFLVDRLCDCIEEFKPARRRRTSKPRPGRAAQLGKLLNLLPARVNSTANPAPGRQVAP